MPKSTREVFEPHQPTVTAIVKFIEGLPLVAGEQLLIDQRTPEEVDQALYVLRRRASTEHPPMKVQETYYNEQGERLATVTDIVPGPSEAEQLEADLATIAQMGGVPLGARYPYRRHEAPQYISGTKPLTPAATAALDAQRDEILSRYGPPISAPRTAAEWENSRAWQRYYRLGGAPPSVPAEAPEVDMGPPAVLAPSEDEIRRKVREILLPLAPDVLSPQDAAQARIRVGGLVERAIYGPEAPFDPTSEADVARMAGDPMERERVRRLARPRAAVIQRIAREVFDELRRPTSPRVNLAVKMLTREFGPLTPDEELCRAGTDLGGLISSAIITQDEAEEILRRVVSIYSARIDAPWDIWYAQAKYLTGTYFADAARLHMIATVQELAIRLAAAAAVGALLGLAVRLVQPLAVPGVVSAEASALSWTEVATFGGTSLARQASCAQGFAELTAFSGMELARPILTRTGVLLPEKPPDLRPGESLAARDTRVILDRVRKHATNLLIFTSMGPIGLAAWILEFLLGDE